MKILSYITICVAAILGLYMLIENRNSSGDGEPDLALSKPATSTSRGNKVGDINPSETKYAIALAEMELTEEELAAKPNNIDETEWRFRVLVHRSNVKEKNGDVKFYGKVVDQNNYPVEGVDIKAFSRQYVESIKEQVDSGGGKVTTKRIQVVTDDEGRFSILGYRGRNLHFESIWKSGYKNPLKLPRFSFSPSYSNRHTPEESSPVVFRIFKKLDPEPLVNTKLRKRIVPDGRSYMFDLKTGEVVKSKRAGVFSINVKADYDAGEGTVGYPWIVEVQGPNKGLIETRDIQPYTAPENGYEANLIWKSKATGEGWSRDLKKAVYIFDEEGGAYSYVKLSVKVFHNNQASVVMDIFLNPAGSRNLYYDTE